MSHALVASMQDVFEYSVFVFCILYILCGLCVTCAVYFCVCFVLSYVLCFYTVKIMKQDTETTYPSIQT